MGAFYEIQWLCDEAFLVYQDASTSWKLKKKKLTASEVIECEALAEKHSEEMQKLCESFKPKSK